MCIYIYIIMCIYIIIYIYWTIHGGSEQTNITLQGTSLFWGFVVITSTTNLAAKEWWRPKTSTKIWRSQKLWLFRYWKMIWIWGNNGKHPNFRLMVEHWAKMRFKKHWTIAIEQWLQQWLEWLKWLVQWLFQCFGPGEKAKLLLMA